MPQRRQKWMLARRARIHDAEVVRAQPNRADALNDLNGLNSVDGLNESFYF